jgi:hypothetical protein
MTGKPIATGSVLTLGIAVLLSGAAAAAGTSEAAAASEANPTAYDPSRRVCRVITPTPSRLARRVCRTQIEWETMSREAQDSFLKHNFDQTRQGPVSNNPSNPSPR